MILLSGENIKTIQEILYCILRKKMYWKALFRKLGKKYTRKILIFFWGEIGPDLISDVFLDKRIMDKTLDEKSIFIKLVLMSLVYFLLIIKIKRKLETLIRRFICLPYLE